MKVIMTLFISLFFNLTASAQTDFDEDIVSFTHMIYTSDLNCISPLGNHDQIYTQLAKFRLSHNSIKMKHGLPRTLGCNTEAINALHSDAFNTFGFTQVTINVLQRTSKEAHLSRGRCIRRYQEQVEVNFDNGLSLKTRLIQKIIPANNCI